MCVPACDTLVLLPGMMCDARLFAAQTAALEQEFRGRLSIIVPALDTANTMAGLAADILRAAPPVFALGGLSMGGILAMEIMAKAPQRVVRLALMDTNPLAETDAGIQRRNRQIRDVQDGRLRQVMADEMKPLYLAESRKKEEILELCMDMALCLGDAVFVRQSQALRDRPNQTGTLKSVHCPTLILYGTQDRLCPPERHQLMNDLIPRAELVKIEGAGHLPPLEAADETYSHLCNWLTL